MLKELIVVRRLKNLTFITTPFFILLTCVLVLLGVFVIHVDNYVVVGSFAVAATSFLLMGLAIMDSRSHND